MQDPSTNNAGNKAAEPTPKQPESDKVTPIQSETPKNPQSASEPAKPVEAEKERKQA